jgi:hypothetical protein
VAGAKILAVKVSTSINQPLCLVSPPALSARLLCFVPATCAGLVEDFFANKYALSNLLFLDIYQCF